jgi:hypothetical protein
VIHGRGLAPSEASSAPVERRRCNLGAWSCGVTFALASETCLGLSVGVGTWFVCSRQSTVKRAIRKMYVVLTGIEDATTRTGPHSVEEGLAAA